MATNSFDSLRRPDVPGSAVSRCCRTFHSQIARALSIDSDEVLALHSVPARPDDLITQNLQCILLQRNSEPRPSEFLRLLLIDLEIYEQNDILPGAFRRFSKWLPMTINRRSIFRMLDLEPLLDAHGERCRLWYNNNIIASDFNEPLHLSDGDYLRVYIGDLQEETLCSSNTEESTDFFVELQLTKSLQPALPVDADPLLFEHFDQAKAVCWTGRPKTASIDEDFDPGQGDGHDRQGPDRHAFDRPPGIDQPQWIHDTWDYLTVHGATEFAEEGPIMYFKSHFLSPRHHRSNRASRPLRFDTDFETWEADVRFMWEDHMDLTAFHMIFVAPEPIASPGQGTVATVLIVQHAMQAQIACLVSYHEGPDVHSQQEIALIIDRQVDHDSLLRHAGLAHLCGAYDAIGQLPCEILVGSVIQHRDHLLLLHDGIGLRVRKPPRTHSTLIEHVQQRQSAEDHDDLQLWTSHWHLHKPLVSSSTANSLGCDVQKLDACLIESWRLLEQEEPAPVLEPIMIPDDQPAHEPPVDRFPDLHEDLENAWRRAAAASPCTETADGVPVIKFVTWFVNSDSWTRCDAYRTVALPEDVETWEDILESAWADRASRDSPAQIALVYPSVSPDSHGGHLIVHQHLAPSERCTLISVLWHDQGSELWNRFARVVPHWLSFQRFLQFADLLDACRRRLFLCVGFSGSHPIEEDRPLFPRHGSHIEIHVAEWQVADDMSLMQQPGVMPEIANEHPVVPPHDQVCAATILNANAQTFVPGQPWGIGSMPEFVQDLHAIWSADAFAWEDEEPSGVALVWFVDHHWPLPHGRVARAVRLYGDFHTWQDRLRHAWADHLVEGAPLEFHLVSPRPPTHEAMIIAHVILIQHPNDFWVTNIVTRRDGREHHSRITQLAITTHEHILLDNLLRVFGIHDDCLGQRARLQCTGWCDSTALQPGRPFPGRSGHSIMLRTQPRPQPRPTETAANRSTRAPVLLQLASLVKFGEFDEPQEDGEADQPMTQGGPTVALRLRSGCSSLQVPTFIECQAPGTEEDIRNELLHFGLRCMVFKFGLHEEALCLPDGWTAEEGHFHYMLCHDDPLDLQGTILHTASQPLDDLALMQALHQMGYCRAAVLDKTALLPQLIRITFIDVVQQAAAIDHQKKTPPPWPKKLMSGRHNTAIFLGESTETQRNDFLLTLGLSIEDLHAFFTSGDAILCRDPTGYEFPETTQQVMQISDTTDLAQFDRIIIYTDGSSIPTHRHRPAEWHEEKGLADTWAFVVVGERYYDNEVRVEIIGWLTHPVRYEASCSSFLGSIYVGSLGAEREAMTWAALWRLSQNINTPTLFRSDSWTTVMQAQGLVGTATVDGAFTALRSSFQALEAALQERLEVAHIPGHCGDPYNDMADWLVKSERARSFYYKRQAISMSIWRPFLPYFWMIFSQTDGLPQWNAAGFHVPPPELPLASAGLLTPDKKTSSSTMIAQIHISLASANVGSMYNGEFGHAGKLDYLRTQFQKLGLNFLGIQEARTPSLSSKTQQVLRFAGGAQDGCLGIEFWVNLEQPYAETPLGPAYFAPQHFVVVHHDPRCMLIHVTTEWIDCWIVVGHAPQSGVPLSERAKWWEHLSEFIAVCPSDARLFALLDANASPGPADQITVFNTLGGESSGTPLLRNFLVDHALCLPCTSPCHVGRHDTWTTPDGLKEHIIDFIVIPQACLQECSLSRVVDEFDLGNSHFDHSAVALQMHWQEQGHPENHLKTRLPGKIDIQNLHEKHVRNALHAYEVLPWKADIDAQVHHFNNHLLGELRSQCPAKSSQPKKPCIDDATWNFRMQKLIARRGLRQISNRHRQELLRFCFKAWSQPQEANPTQFWQYRQWLCCVNVKIFARHPNCCQTTQGSLESPEDGSSKKGL